MSEIGPGVDGLRRPDSGIDEPTLDVALRHISHSGAREGPGPEGLPQAAVAAVFKPGRLDTELLFIERATREGDPWSGHMAFPGGRSEDGDRDSFHTAERETVEELGLDLDPAGRLGSLTDVEGGRATNRLLTVSGHCYWWPESGYPPLEPNEEVADALWVPLSDLLDRGRYIDYWYPPSGSTFPGIQLDDDSKVIWGLTLRFLADLFGRLDRSFIIN